MQGEEPTQLDSPDVFDAHDVPVATRRPMPRMVGRKRALPFEDKAGMPMFALNNV